MRACNSARLLAVFGAGTQDCSGIGTRSYYVDPVSPPVCGTNEGEVVRPHESAWCSAAEDSKQMYKNAAHSYCSFFCLLRRSRQPSTTFDLCG